MDYFGFLSWIFEKKGLNHQKSRQAVRVLCCDVETHAAAKAHAKAWPNVRLVKPRVRRDIAELCRGKELRRSEKLRLGVATVHSMFVSLFCCSEDLSIGLMRTL